MNNIFYHNQHSFDLARQLDLIREDILRRWEQDRLVGYVMQQHNIDQRFFVIYFGSKVLDYFIKVLSNEEKIGQCPVIIVMVKFFSHKKITLQNLFICCAGFKNNVTNAFVENSKHDEKGVDFHKLRALEVVFDLNFSGVIQEFIDYGYCVTQCPQKLEPQSLETKEQLDIEAFEKQMQLETQKSFYDKSLIQYHSDELHEFHELEEEMIFLIDKYHNNDALESTHILFSKKLTKYASTMLLNPIFKDLGESLFSLAHLFSNPLHHKNIERYSQDIAILMDCFINDLMLWREHLNTASTEEKIHYYDQSIISNVRQISMLISSKEQTSGECEFF